MGPLDKLIIRNKISLVSIEQPNIMTMIRKQITSFSQLLGQITWLKHLIKSPRAEDDNLTPRLEPDGIPKNLLKKPIHFWSSKYSKIYLMYMRHMGRLALFLFSSSFYFIF
ncbi:hypothetical protein ACJX0J_006446 [Zea mays]